MGGGTILVVEDNERNMKLLRDLLQAHGYSTLEASSGEDALDLAAEHRPDLVLMDVQLPGLDGRAALGLLRALPATAHIPVVAVTAQAMRGDRERFLDAGFDGYAAKPLDIHGLLELVGRHCVPAPP